MLFTLYAEEKSRMVSDDEGITTGLLSQDSYQTHKPKDIQELETLVSDFAQFHKCLVRCLARAVKLRQSTENLVEEMMATAKTFETECLSIFPSSEGIVQDCHITVRRLEKKDGIIEFCRDFHFNLIDPLKAHISQCEEIDGLLKRDKDSPAAIEWIRVLNTHKGDILDSIAQTLKCCERNFFASMQMMVEDTLPSKIQFRPMVEMVPQRLKDRMDLKIRPTPPATPVLDSVDAFSLAALVSQGFEEHDARNALTLFENDTQKALDFMVGCSSRPPPRKPTSVLQYEKNAELGNLRLSGNRTEYTFL